MDDVLRGRVRALASQKLSAEVISVRTGAPLYEVIDELVRLSEPAPALPKRKGRPPSAGRCKHCGARPSHQSSPTTRTTTQP